MKKHFPGRASLLIGTVLVAGFVAAVYSFPAREYVENAMREEPLRVLFVGDLMLDRNVARSAEEEGVSYLFSSSTLALFAEADMRVANWEGTITDNPSVARRDHTVLRFTFAPAVAQQVLALLRLDAVSLANNHALDFGEFGYEETRMNLQEAGVQSFGQPFNDTDKLSSSVTVKNKKICLVGFHALFANNLAKAVDETARLRPDCWRLVVVAHWGEEYELVATSAQQEAARAFVDGGADLIIGAHPHVVQNKEIYKGKAIFYSLGNFMFDQNFSWETTHSLAVRADFYEGKTAFVLTPLIIVEQRSSVAGEPDKSRILRAVGDVAEFTLP